MHSEVYGHVFKKELKRGSLSFYTHKHLLHFHGCHCKSNHAIRIKVCLDLLP
jgi:hypothetical protein